MSEKDHRLTITAASYEPLLYQPAGKSELFYQDQGRAMLWGLYGSTCPKKRYEDESIALFPEPVIVPNPTVKGLAWNNQMEEVLKPILDDCGFKNDQIVRIILTEPHPDGHIVLFSCATVFDLFEDKVTDAAGSQIRDLSTLSSLFLMFGQTPALKGAYKASKMLNDLF